MESRNIILAVLIIAIAIGVFYMLDPSLGGLLRKKYEGFEDNGNVIQGNNGPASMNGMEPNMFANTGASNVQHINENEHVISNNGANGNYASNNGVVGVNAGVETTEGFENLAPSPMPFAGAEKPANCYPKNQLTPQELLPNDPNSKWAQVNPMGAGDIAGKNFLNSGALIGVDTVGQSNRNASWDIRSLPANPQVQVSPWMQSTIEPDLVRRPLE
jgi:hypothetical protein